MGKEDSKNMLKGNIILLILGTLLTTVILGGLGYLVIKTITLSENVISVKENLKSTCDRVERIASALPDLQVKIAYEELKRPISTAVIITKPKQDNKSISQMKSYVIVLGVDSSEKWEWELAVDSKTNKEDQLFYSIMGVGFNEDNAISTFNDIEKRYTNIKLTNKFPTNINTKMSFILHNENSKEFIKKIESCIPASSFKVTAFKIKNFTNDSSGLLDIIIDNPDLFDK